MRFLSRGPKKCDIEVCNIEASPDSDAGFCPAHDRLYRDGLKKQEEWLAREEEKWIRGQYQQNNKDLV